MEIGAQPSVCPAGSCGCDMSDSAVIPNLPNYQAIYVPVSSIRICAVLFHCAGLRAC